ncbi:cytochrome p450 2u1 [Plakobranchus ocellatus]|uniref:Cytochrome p450 2u1 n=1 Tax=Plakobranchus ocellatus TaxID=259542 RepID=A0AAV4A1A8_9GAST|nr:cytochrome p450 2u1 [Plakobranchus ocellatus]
MVSSGFQVLRQARAPVTAFKPATKASLQISGQICYPLCHRRSLTDQNGFSVLKQFISIAGLKLSECGSKVETVGKVSVYRSQSSRKYRGKQRRGEQWGALNWIDNVTHSGLSPLQIMATTLPMLISFAQDLTGIACTRTLGLLSLGAKIVKTVGSTGTLALALLTLFLFYWWRSAKPRYLNKENVPPYPARPWPFFGHLLMVRKDPRGTFLRWRRKCGDIFSLDFCGKHVVVLNGYDLLKEVLVRHADLVTVRPKTLMAVVLNEYNKGIINASGRVWKEQRTAALTILRAFGMGKNIMAAKIREEVDVYLQEISKLGGQPSDIRVLTGVSISNVICSIIMGQKFEHDDPFFRQMIGLVAKIVTQIGGTALLNHVPVLRHLPGDFFRARELQRNTKDVSEIFISPVIERHKANFDPNLEPSDFIDAYLSQIAHRDNHAKDKTSSLNSTLNDDNLNSVIKNIFAAGSETTGSTIMWCLLFLLHHPLEQEKVYRQIEAVIGTDRVPEMADRPHLTYLTAVIMETQRLASIAPFSFQRVVASDIKVKGYTIPEGSVIIPSLDSVLLDEGLWGDPFNFRPERFLDDNCAIVQPDYFVPFSMGKRVCIGEALAKMELFLYLSSLLQRFKVLPAQDGILPEIRAKFGMTCAPEDFTLRLVERTCRQ